MRLTLLERMRHGHFAVPVLWLVTGAMIFAPVIAYAQQTRLNWKQYSNAQVNPAVKDELSQMAGGRIYMNTNLGAAIIKLKSNQIDGNTVLGMPWGTKAVYAKYEPQTGTGTIFVTRSIRRANGDGIVQIAQWKPSYFDIYKSDFKVGDGSVCSGVNPFWQFVPAAGTTAASKGLFEHISMNAFETAVGLVMQHVDADQGWIARAQTNVHHRKHKGGFLTVHVHVWEWADTKPTWISVSPSNMGMGHDVGFVVPIKNSTQSSVSTCHGESVRNLGQPTSTTYSGSTVGAVKLAAGVNFSREQPYNNLPHNQFQSFYHSVNKSGWGFGFDLLIGGVLGAGMLNPVMSFGFAKLVQSITGSVNANAPSTQSTKSYTKVVNTTNNLTNSVSAYGSADTQSNLNKSSSTNVNNNSPAVTSATINVSQMLSYLYSPSMSSGVSTGPHSQHPLQQSNQWDPYPSVASNVNKGMGQTPGGFATQANAVRPRASQMRSKAPLAVDYKQLGSTLNFDTSPFGPLQ